MPTCILRPSITFRKQFDDLAIIPYTYQPSSSWRSAFYVSDCRELTLGIRQEKRQGFMVNDRKQLFGINHLTLAHQPLAS